MKFSIKMSLFEISLLKFLKTFYNRFLLLEILKMFLNFFEKIAISSVICLIKNILIYWYITEKKYTLFQFIFKITSARAIYLI